MTGNDFLALADELLKNPSLPTEAVLRTVISRAYYGAFHLARAFLADAGLKHGREHGDVWRLLGSSGVIVAKQAATGLAVLHENRTIADYDLSSPKPKSQAFARDNVERAKYVQSLLDACRQEPLRSEIKNGIVHRQK